MEHLASGCQDYLVRKVLLIASRDGDVAEEALSLEGSQCGRQANATGLNFEIWILWSHG